MSDRSETLAQPSPAVVVGFGNILLQDDGIGIHVIQRMDNLPRQSAPGYRLIDGGTCPDVLLYLPNEVSTLIVIDAVKGGGKPGTIYRFRPHDIESKIAALTSLHQLGLRAGLEIMKLSDRYPSRVIIIGVEPEKIDWGLKLSPELEKTIPQVIRLVEQEIAQQIMNN